MGRVPSPGRRGLSRAIAITLTASFALSLALAGTASAAIPLHQLQDDHFIYPADGSPPTELCPGSTDVWLGLNNSGKDSPLDGNIKGWKVVNPAIDPVEGNCAVSAWTNASYPSMVIPVANVRNMSFDWRTATGTPPGSASGGSPRIVVYFDTGDLVAMDAVSCWKPIGAFGWARSDFTGFKSTDASCTIYLNNTVPYANTPTQSAWQVLAAANPTFVTDFSFIVMDQPGTYYLDRIAFGTQRLYGSGDLPTQSCSTEAGC